MSPTMPHASDISRAAARRARAAQKEVSPRWRRGLVVSPTLTDQRRRAHSITRCRLVNLESLMNQIAAAEHLPAQSGCKPCQDVAPRAKSGRSVRFRNTVLSVPSDLMVPTCKRCGAVHYERASQGVRQRLQQLYDQQLLLRIRPLIGEACEALGVSQRGLEKLLNLSAGYLSRLRGGHGLPSVALLNALWLLRHQPELKAQLDHFWDSPVKAEDFPPAYSELRKYPAQRLAARGRIQREPLGKSAAAAGGGR